MRIETTHMVDASEPDARGAYAYRYEYDVFRFSNEQMTLVARGYTDEPRKAHFLRLDCSEESRGLTSADLSLPLFLEAVSYLRSVGRNELSWLGEVGYEALPAGA